jgi:monoamine oxidase
LARSPLLRFLRKIAALHAEADSRGVEVQQVVDERAGSAPRRFGRRRVLAGSAFAAAALALPARAKSQAAPRIAIVGGGIAGLSCALRLADAGVASTVYEAKGRVGGRMFSNRTGYWADGQVTEWCGELIDTGHTEVIALADRFGLPLDNQHAAEPFGATETYQFLGSYYSYAQAVADFQAIFAAVKHDAQKAGWPTTYDNNNAYGRALDAMSVYDWIESRVPGGHSSPMGRLLDVAYNIEYGGTSREQSCLGLVFLLAYQPDPQGFGVFGESDETYHVRGGNQRIPEAIASHLGSAVQLGQRLSDLRQRSDGTFALTFTSGRTSTTQTADVVVLALPFAILRNMDLSRLPFDPLKLKAIREQGAGHNGKLQLQFNRRLWNEPGPWGLSSGTFFTDNGAQAGWEPTRGQPGTHGILNDYTGAEVTDSMATNVAFATIADKNVQRDAARFLGQAELLFPGVGALFNGKATSSIPHLDADFGLAYSYWKVGQYTSFSGYERVRQGNVLFAGEHCSVDFGGYMEGGATEGARAAGEILAQLK